MNLNKLEHIKILSKKLLLGGFFICVFSGGISELYAQTPSALNNFLKSPSLKYAGVGIKITEVETSKAVCAYNENLTLSPASTLKMITTATALELLGPEYRFTTTISHDSIIDTQGMLQGNLWIIGSGDPTLGSSFFEESKEKFFKEWSDTLKRIGIKSIAGDIIVVDNLYGYEGISDRWTWGDIGNYYASGTFGISLFDNTYKLFLKSGASQTTPLVLYTDPEIKGMTFENYLKVASNSSDSAYIRGIPFAPDRKIYGTVPANKSSFFIKGDIPDPGLLLAQTLSENLLKNGIKIYGNFTTIRLKKKEIPSQLKKIYVHNGKSLKEIIEVTNFRSNNHFAEHLFYKIGKENKAMPGYTPSLATETIKKYWQQKGIDTQGLYQYDGSGLSNANAVSVSILTDILVYMKRRSKYADVFYQSLPLTGKEGTVRNFLKGTDLESKARIKSGSISNVQSYAGYINKNGKTYAFAILVNHFTGSRATLRKQMENFLVQFNP